MTINIVYQFTKEMEKYEGFFRRIEVLSEGNFRQITDGCILAQVYLTPSAIRRELLPFLQKDDRLFLSSFGRECCGQLPEKSKKWLKSNVFERQFSEEILNGLPKKH